MTEATPQEIEDMFAPYEDVAVDIISDESPNTAAGMRYSNAQLAEMVCQLMNWQDFDLFDAYDFEGVLNGSDLVHHFAYGLVAFLRYRLFREAINRDIGEPGFNAVAEADSEFWYCRLIEKWSAKGGPLPERRLH